MKRRKEKNVKEEGKKIKMISIPRLLKYHILPFPSVYPILHAAIHYPILTPIDCKLSPALVFLSAANRDRPSAVREN